MSGLFQGRISGLFRGLVWLSIVTPTIYQPYFFIIFVRAKALKPLSKLKLHLYYFISKKTEVSRLYGLDCELIRKNPSIFLSSFASQCGKLSRGKKTYTYIGYLNSSASQIKLISTQARQNSIRQTNIKLF